MGRSNSGLIEAAMMVVLVVLVIFSTFLPGLLVDQRVAVDAMGSAGYTNVQVVSRWTFLVGIAGCSGEDSVKFDVIATGPNGKQIKNAYVCSGFLFKGSTIRYR